MYFEWKDLTINDSFEYACINNGTKNALVYRDRTLTYQELQREVFELTNALKQCGVTKGTRVAHLLPDVPEWVYLFYATLNLGAIIVPLNLTWVGREIQQGLHLTDAEVLITIDDFRGKQFSTIIEEQFSELQNAERDNLQIKNLPRLKKIITLSPSGKKYNYAYDFLELKKSGSEYNAQSILSLSKEVKPDDICAYMLTSGSTGFPKPVIHTQNTILFAVANLVDCHDIRPDERILHFGPTYHVAGIVIFLMSHIRGSAMHQADYFEPEWAMRIIEEEKISVMWGFDVHYLMMRRHPRYKAYDLSSLDRILIGNSPGSYKEIKTMGVPHHGNIYGSSENSGCHAHFPYRHRHDENRKKYSNGIPLSFNETKIVDPETGNLLGLKEMGEICTRGPGLFKGYYNMPKETAETMDDEGFYHSGDYGYLDEKGYIYYRGRIKDTVKTGGENVSAREVEITLEGETPWINTAIVVGVPDPKWGEAVIAVIELRPGENIEGEALRESCKKLMANYKIPKKFIFVKPEEWIVTPTGKFDKKAIRSKVMEQLGIKDTI